MMIQTAAGGQSPEAVYQKACKVCHASGLAGAPRMGHVADWKVRRELTMEALLHSVVQGKGSMPAKGMCMDCSTEDFVAVIRYMMSEQ
ncbi:MAG: cytochrome c5 family protein [Endozoicomonadaceae bacterium]|nr:cytochrome c5 family protein [Endozoicomonadaceae bacterium]